MRSPLICAVLLLTLVAGAAAMDANRYSYLSFDQVTITLSGEQAKVVAEYRIDAGIRPLVAIFGRGDLQQKVRRILNYPDARVISLSLDRAELLVANASTDYGEGSFWFPAHEFGVTIPSLVVSSPQNTRTFNQTASFPRGMGYFGATPPSA
ncbi:MAG TPA: hypothetical protein PK089_03965 [Methanoregulaceae archaeon]|nr:hypothetical protein [Methanoregulaceae archaeon]HQJ87488.1 hypothetical protein [Methanoregulaceae archaeon]